MVGNAPSMAYNVGHNACMVGNFPIMAYNVEHIPNGKHAASPLVSIS